MEPKGSSALGEELTANNNMYEQMLTTKSLIVGLFIVTIVSPSHLQHSDGAAFRRKRIESKAATRFELPPQKVPHPCDSGKGGANPGRFQ